VSNLEIPKPGEYPWRTEIKLKFPGCRRRRVAFRYEWKAWLLAYEVMKMGPEEFHELPPDVQLTAVHYGAAVWERMVHRKSTYFTYDDMVEALNKASKEDNILLATTMGEARFPEWMDNLPQGKKKAKGG